MNGVAAHWAGLMPMLAALALKLAGALLLFAAGRWLITAGVRALTAALARARIDAALVRFAANAARVLLHIMLIVALLGLFGVRLLGFAALLTGVGLALGGALSGLLGDLAAGALMLVLRPVHVGDDVTLGESSGIVLEIGMFRTVLCGEDNVRLLVGNARLLGETIVNRSATPWINVPRALTLAHGSDIAAVMAQLQAGLGAIAEVRADPPPEVQVQDYTADGVVIELACACHSDDAEALGFAVNRLIARVIGPGGAARAHMGIIGR